MHSTVALDISEPSDLDRTTEKMLSSRYCCYSGKIEMIQILCSTTTVVQYYSSIDKHRVSVRTYRMTNPNQDCN
jgi:hypothetical protein